MDWNRGNAIGRGSTAAVYIAHRSGEVFAVKSAEFHRSEFLKREQRILSTLNCPQIVAYQGFDITMEKGVRLFNLFMEYAPHGTLADRGGGMEETVVKSYTRQILQGLNYLHSKGIVHCDVKGQNLLVTEQGVKIADLGCARRVEESSVIAGTPAFMAPEVARGEEQGFPADVWALGCTVVEMITGKSPWHGVCDPAAAVYRVGFAGEVPEIPSFVSEQGRDFLGKCLKRDPRERWTVEELLGHGFVKECKELKLLTLDSDTPRSVLERGFWDSLEASKQFSTDDYSWGFPSPADRIRRLFSSEPNWDDDHHHWVTVRSNDMQLELEATICNVSDDDDKGLVVCNETKFVFELITWDGNGNGISDDCYLRGRECACHVTKSLSICLCLMMEILILTMKEIFTMHCFISLFLFNSTLDELMIS